MAAFSPLALQMIGGQFISIFIIMKNVYFCNKSVTYEGVFKKYLKNESERLENYL